MAMALGPVPAAAGAHPAAGAHTAAWAHAAASPPPGREWAAFAYYPPRHELVLFGGRHPGMVFGDTWTRTGATWTQQHPATAPSARTGAAMVYDPASRQLLLFGGGATTGTGFSNQTWTWNGSTWTLLHPATSPPAREDTGMVYDAATKTVLLFAGWHGAYWDDTWSWNGTTWTPLSPAASPGVDVFAWQAAYDPASHQVVAFGGDGGGGKPFLSGTWTWTGSNWSRLSPAASPPGRAYGTLTYDSADQRVVLFAGSEQALTVFPSTIWSWSGSTWAQGT